MSFRPPQSLTHPASVENGFNVLEYELNAERANSLGRSGLKAEAALAELKAWESGKDSAEHRDQLLRKATDAVWELFVQREICGLRNGRDFVQRYGVPDEVMARLGSNGR
ncbi:hypothetical protein QTL95_13575 [Rhizobium sp. S152]|uniref:DUF6665 family protein n=1 Tax=Rhizobium sp. S152 TaxID=3055038 RepID=UPI0025A96470|nr:DUF6665 family protein [Rhizobium sp. S152]MDM9626931.1 hypothetical protein [Rhizobium sp. S152]